MFFPLGYSKIILSLNLVEGNEANLGKVLKPLCYLLGLNLPDPKRIAAGKHHNRSRIHAAIVIGAD
jgi:hypothetical protein